jgi:hypothetical protein
MCDASCPTTVAQRMDFHPDPVLPLVQLQGARTAWNPKMPMMAAGASCKFTLAPNDEAALPALVENLRGGELDIEFEHGWLSS